MIKARKKILVVDDDPVMVRFSERLLHMDGYAVATALNGKTGLTKAKEERPDLILLDVLMPDMSGVELAKRLTTDPETQDIPIVFMTITIPLDEDHGNQKIDINGRHCQAFAKPNHRQKLLSVIRKAINRKVNHNQDAS